MRSSPLHTYIHTYICTYTRGQFVWCITAGSLDIFHVHSTNFWTPFLGTEQKTSLVSISILCRSLSLSFFSFLFPVFNIDALFRLQARK
ncbi:hypothetical protein M432DRAFT_355515 [Thermoascus aurantiacus ATCC 26904]